MDDRSVQGAFLREAEMMARMLVVPALLFSTSFSRSLDLLDAKISDSLPKPVVCSLTAELVMMSRQLPATATWHLLADQLVPNSQVHFNSVLFEGFNGTLVPPPTTVMGWSGDDRAHARAYRVFVAQVRPLVAVTYKLRVALRGRAALLHSVSHENLLPFVGAVTLGPQVSLVYARWGIFAPLDRVINNVVLSSSPDRMLTNMLRGMVLGLAALHGAGVIHGMLSPDHVLVSPTGTIKLMMYGMEAILAHTAPRLVATKDICLAPEVVMGERAKPAADIYAFGVLAIWLLNGRQPFANHSLHEFIAEVTGPAIDSPPELVLGGDANLIPSLASALSMATCRAPSMRPTAPTLATVLTSVDSLYQESH
ncbi:serine/threonine protein kinase [Thecamonas trahens ATCC 50062]|uniref:Serine/threonine protein kinase n=1 Tax=Thecamonas trahens ATCC 50062 TaxID=461836 RepID=A0A0L0D4F0_THETB|nr:serine/threonine protein kinase [Thecamonas trahens ATCC 50062]KNC46981.1 serine/threonine protein kinase [Thecamonas trahens ATCC 50062]|eukprot:XP_013760250.1 serine/threonine protein kinase [Thecamonas trahens ATCC 50062]